MFVKILSITLLLFSVYLCFHDTAAPDGCRGWCFQAKFGTVARRNPSRSRLCCVGITSKNKSSEVVGETYREQRAKSPCVNAIIFNTDDGKLCADPKAPWVKNLTTNMMKV